MYHAPVLIPALHIEFPSLFVGAPLDGPLVCAMRCGAPLDDSLDTGASLKKAETLAGPFQEWGDREWHRIG